MIMEVKFNFQNLTFFFSSIEKQNIILHEWMEEYLDAHYGDMHIDLRHSYRIVLAKDVCGMFIDEFLSESRQWV